MSMLTSLYSSRHGVTTKEKHLKLSDSTITLADILHDKGYTTVAFTGGGHVSEDYNYHTFDIFDSDKRRDIANPGDNFETMINWLDNNHKERFFLFWHDFTPHAPYAPRIEFDIFSDKGYSGIVDVYPTREDKKTFNYFKGIIDNMSIEDIEYVKAKYDGEILSVDQRFSVLIETLKRENILDKTLIIFTSDHGESFADREKGKRIGHHQMYGEVLRVPLIIKIPGNEKQIWINNSVESIDIMPTILDILNIQKPSDIDGTSLFIKMNSSDNIAYSESIDYVTEYSIKYRNLKLIYYETRGYFELYDLGQDPHERDNIFGRNTSAEMKIVDILLSRIPKEITQAESVEIENETLEQLRTLGYLT